MYMVKNIEVSHWLRHSDDGVLQKASYFASAYCFLVSTLSLRIEAYGMPLRMNLSFD